MCPNGRGIGKKCACWRKNKTCNIVRRIEAYLLWCACLGYCIRNNDFLDFSVGTPWGSVGNAVLTPDSCFSGWVTRLAPSSAWLVAPRRDAVRCAKQAMAPLERSSRAERLCPETGAARRVRRRAAKRQPAGGRRQAAQTELVSFEAGRTGDPWVTSPPRWQRRRITGTRNKCQEITLSNHNLAHTVRLSVFRFLFLSLLFSFFFVLFFYLYCFYGYFPYSTSFLFFFFFCVFLLFILFSFLLFSSFLFLFLLFYFFSTFLVLYFLVFSSVFLFVIDFNFFLFKWKKSTH